MGERWLRVRNHRVVLTGALVIKLAVALGCLLVALSLPIIEWARFHGSGCLPDGLIELFAIWIGYRCMASIATGLTGLQPGTTAPASPEEDSKAMRALRETWRTRGS